MEIGEGVYRLSNSQITLLEKDLMVVNYFSIIYGVQEFDSAFSDFISFIDSYDNLCDKKKNKFWYSCELKIGKSFLSDNDDIIVDIVLYEQNIK